MKKRLKTLRKVLLPIYEPGLDSLIKKDVEVGRFTFYNSLKECLNDVDAVFLAVGTPPNEDGSADLYMFWRLLKRLAGI